MIQLGSVSNQNRGENNFPKQPIPRFETRYNIGDGKMSQTGDDKLRWEVQKVEGFGHDGRRQECCVSDVIMCLDVTA
jgi:hypothetical protein